MAWKGYNSKPLTTDKMEQYKLHNDENFSDVDQGCPTGGTLQGFAWSARVPGSIFFLSIIQFLLAIVVSEQMEILQKESEWGKYCENVQPR